MITRDFPAEAAEVLESMASCSTVGNRRWAAERYFVPAFGDRKTERGFMGVRPRVVYENGRWNGRPLREWVTPVVDDIVAACNPVRVIFFGSVAREEEGPDSDLDFLVVLDGVDPAKKPRLMAQIRRAISAPVPVDVFVTHPEECERRKDVIGSMHYWPLREDLVVYERAA